MAYNTNGVQFYSGTLSSSQINNMNNTGQIILPASGNGLVNFIIGTFFNVIVGSIPWSNEDFGNVWLIYGTSGNDRVNLASAQLTNQIGSMSANTNYIFGTGSGIGSDWLGGTTSNINKVLSSTAINVPVSITCSNTISSSGNGTINYGIWYATLNCQ